MVALYHSYTLKVSAIRTFMDKTTKILLANRRAVMKDLMKKFSLKEFIWMTIGIEIMVIGIYFFKFPNNFSFGGATGIAVILSKYTVGFLTRGNIIVIFNVLLLIIGFLFLGKEFGLKTVYCSLVMSFSLQGLEYIVPLKGPLTNETIMELVYAIFLPAIGSAILFNIGASSGGTDILAMLLKKYTSMNIGVALMSADCILAALTFPIYGIKTGLMSMLGLGVKALVIDNVIESINLCKYINIVCNDPDPITKFIGKELNRSATVVDAKGAYSGQHKFMVLTVVNRRQAVLLRNFLRETEPTAFIIITSTSEIVGKGFMRI